MSLLKPTNINDLSIDYENEFATLISVELNDYLKDVQLDKQTMSEALVQKLNI
ncbi:hypothetical protein B835_2969 [Enterococcus mundtii 3F]|nr:hypothetical protein [Enterococcus mundtii 3F]